MSCLSQDESPRAGGLHALIEAGSYAEAEAAARPLLAEIEARDGPDSLRVAEVLDVLVEALTELGTFREPDLLADAERAVRVKERSLGPEDPAVAWSLENLGHVLLVLEGQAAARPILERALSIAERHEDQDPLLLASVLTSTGYVLRLAGEETQAETLFQRALAIQEETAESRPLTLAESLLGLGTIRADAADFQGAEALMARAVRIVEDAYGPGHPKIAELLNYLAICVREAGRRAEARSLLERALEIGERSYGSTHPTVAKSLKELASDHFIRGEIPEARQLLQRAAAIQEETLGPEHISLASTLNTLAWVLYVSGEYAESRALYERSIAIKEKVLGPDHSILAWTLTAFGNLLRRTGDLDEARRVLERALAIAESASVRSDSLIAACLVSLAGLLEQSGELREARELYEEGLPLFEKVHGAESPDTLEIRNAFAGLLVKSQEWGEARHQYEQILAAREELLGPSHFQVGNTLYDLAHLLEVMGETARARQLYERALEILEQTFGPDAPKVGAAALGASRVLASRGENESALLLALRAERIGRESTRLTIEGLPERQALRFPSVRKAALDLALTLVAHGGAVEASGAEEVFDSLIRSRALVLDEMAVRHRLVTQSGDLATERLAQRLAVARNELAKLTLRGPGESIPEEYRASLDIARREKEQSEELLAARSALFRQDLERQRIGLEEVSRDLPGDSVLVAYVKYERFPVRASVGSASETDARPERGDSPVRSYLALVLPFGKRQPVVVALGEARAIRQLVDACLDQATTQPSGVRSAARRAERAYREAGEALRRAVWDPVAEHFGDARRIFVVPDGALHRVTLAALPSGRSGYLVESEPVVHYLSAERDLVRGTPAGRGKQLLAVGNPDFESEPGRPPPRALEMARLDLSEGLAPGIGEVYRGARSACTDFQSSRFVPMPGALEEVREIAELWSGRFADGHPDSDTALVLTGNASHEAILKQVAPRHNVIHIATHGFFLDRSCPLAPETSGATKRNADSGARLAAVAAAENPLLLSGLALAGANRRDSAVRGEEDGILTAEEIASLDLSGVEWVVLSACRTGLGTVVSGEGVLGLRRAFEVAGADTLIMSLWSVRDDAARVWMRQLYEGRLEGLSTDQAVRQASLQIIEDRRRAGRSTHPFYWGAFVAAGDWR
jgi:CHAT domain-containing protein/Tfp pilus assembly protein PilF